VVVLTRLGTLLAGQFGCRKNDYGAAQHRKKLMTEQADRVCPYTILKREDTNRQLYDSMLQRVKEAGVASALRASDVRVVDTAKLRKTV
jgi:hypothetical protein